MKNFENFPSKMGKWSCPICKQSLKSPVIANCGHTFCWRCLCMHLEHDTHCPICDKEIEENKFVAIKGIGQTDPDLQSLPPLPEQPPMPVYPEENSDDDDIDGFTHLERVQMTEERMRRAQEAENHLRGGQNQINEVVGNMGLFAFGVGPLLMFRDIGQNQRRGEKFTTKLILIIIYSIFALIISNIFVLFE